MKTNTFDILYEDDSIIVCYKSHGVPTQSRSASAPDMESMILNHLATASKASAPYLAVIHRLDQPVAGILVFAKTPAAAKELNRQLTTEGFGKYYQAQVDGIPAATKGTLVDYLVKDGRTNTSRVCTKGTQGAKEARLSYQVIESNETTNTSTLIVQLDTGRHHQIRVQLAHMGCPIIGDTKYNPKAAQQKGWQELKLCAYRLNFRHPKTKKAMSFQLPIQ